MPHRVIVISPDAKLGASLQDAFQNNGLDVNSTLIDEYVTMGRLKTIVDSEPEPVAAFVIGFSDSEVALHLVKRLPSSYEGALIVGAGLNASSEHILAAMRSGASEFLAPPFEMNFLHDALAKRQAAQSKAPELGQLSCILPAKAGSGASTIALHVAAGVARASQKKTLLVDYDFHCGMAAFRLRLQPDFTFIDALSRAGDIDEMWEKLACRWKHFDVLAAPEQDEVVSGEALRDATRVFSSAARNYSHVIVDLPPGSHASSRDVLELADTIYVISTPEMLALHLARRRVNELVSLGISERKMRLVISRAESALAVNTEDIAGVAGIPIYWAIPNNYGAVSEASLRGTLVSEKSRLGLEYAALACDIAGVKPQAHSKPVRRGWKSFFPLQVAKASSIG